MGTANSQGLSHDESTSKNATCNKKLQENLAGFTTALKASLLLNKVI
jgi:hypothetical protein